MIRRITAAVLCIGVLGGAAATAEAAFKAGTYKGKTAQNAKVSLKVLKNKKAVIKFYWEGTVLSCSDGEERQLAGDTTPSSEKFALTRSGKFGFTGTLRSGAGEDAVRGQIKGSTAKGVIQVQRKVNPETNSVDPEGTVTCDSELVQWTAKRR